MVAKRYTGLDSTSQDDKGSTISGSLLHRIGREKDGGKLQHADPHPSFNFQSSLLFLLGDVLLLLDLCLLGKQVILAVSFSSAMRVSSASLAASAAAASWWLEW